MQQETKMKNFKVEIRKNCKVCGEPITGDRFRTYCSKECRNKFHNTKHRPEHKEWQRKKRDAIASEMDARKVQCLICGKWYVQVGSHAVQVHGVSGREYRENFDLEVKKGIVPGWYRELKGSQALENGTYKNLKKGAIYRYKRGDTEAGRYKRSPITIERLKKLHVYNKKRNTKS